MIKFNSHPLTLKDKRNEEAYKHLNHEIVSLGNGVIFSHKIPYRYIEKKSYYCVDCKKTFKVYNWYDKKKPINDTIIEQ